MNLIKVLYLTNSIVLISQIEEAPSELGEPDCKLTKPCVVKVVNGEKYLESFMMDYSKQNVFMISSDKILTLTEPTPTLLEKYQEFIKE